MIDALDVVAAAVTRILVNYAVVVPPDLDEVQAEGLYRGQHAVQG